MATFKENLPGVHEIEIFVRPVTGERLTFMIDADAPLLELKQKISNAKGVPPSHIRLMFAGKQLADYVGNTNTPTTLLRYNIQKESTIHMMSSPPSTSNENTASLPTPAIAAKCHSKREAEAIAGDFDEDLHIVDPHSHFELLKQLERDVVQRSEYFKTKRTYTLSSIIEPKDADGAVLDQFGFPPLLRSEIERSSMKLKAFQHEDDVSYKISWHLLKTYSIVINVSKSVQQMISLRFCTDKISFLMVHPHSKIVEIKRIPSDMITEVETSLREASLKMLETLDERLFLEILRGWAKAPSRSFLELAGFGDLPADVLNENVTLTDLRKLALLLDMAVVSYVRSHGSGFDGSYFGHDLQYLEASDGDDEMGFRCFWARLGCLDSFLDKRKVWVFNIYLKDQDGNSLPRQEDEGPEPKSLLTRMEDLADIWGPVYTVPSNAGGVKYYGVSKGVICRVKSKQGTPVGQAVPCHYFSRLSYFRRKASRLLRTADDDLELAGNELLLIGAGFRDNRKCLYTRSAFIEEMKPRMTVLGTKESVWKTDSRGLAFTLSKYLGVTVSGTQKLIPQTSLKQHILDKWTTRPTRSNPTILSQYLGVEISHCTGNARRISIKELMLSEPIRPILDRQSPNWVQTPWGSALNAALRSAKTDDLISVWKEFKLNRSEMAELVCCTLELLDDTGWNEQDEFHSALLFNNEEWAVAMSTKENSWMVALRDTHLTGAYVITNEICIECEVPDHTTSTCENAKSYTVLQTQFATARKPRPFRKADFRLRPFGERFHTAECGSPNITFLTTSSSRDLFKRLRGQGYDECAEVMNPAGFRSTANTVYIRASTRSVHGKHEIKNGMGDLVFRDRTLQSSIGTGHDSVEDNPVGEMEKSTSLNGCRSPVEGMPPMQWGTTQMSPFSLKSAGEQRGTQAPSSASNDSALRPEVTGDSSMRKTPFIDDLENHRPLNGIRQSFWPIQSHDIDDKEHGLIPSDIHGQNVWDFQFRQTKPLTARDSDEIRNENSFGKKRKLDSDDEITK